MIGHNAEILVRKPDTLTYSINSLMLINILLPNMLSGCLSFHGRQEEAI